MARKNETKKSSQNNKVVTANYNDRQSKNKWLVRNQRQKPQNAVGYPTVKATNVIFKRSSAVEVGFGCTMIASCETTQTDTNNFRRRGKNIVRLRFRGFWFEDLNGNRVEKLKTLYLNKDGSMYGKLLVEKTTTAKKHEEVGAEA